MLKINRRLPRVNFGISAKVDYYGDHPPIISNVTARESSSTEEIKSLLISQIEKKVRWLESVEYMINNGVKNFVEIGPGKVLSGLIKRINKNVKVNSINNEEDIKLLIND